jgi:hypothetical protein
LSLEMKLNAGAVVVFYSGGSTEVPQSPGTEALPGSKSTAYTHRGSPGTWEVLSSPSP